MHQGGLEELTNEVVGKEPNITNYVGSVLVNTGEKFYVTMNKEAWENVNLVQSMSCRPSLNLHIPKIWQ